MTASKANREHRDDHVGEGPGAHRRPLATALLGGDQVDRAHALLLQGQSEGQGQSSGGRVVEVRERARPPDLEPLPEVALQALA